LVTDIEEDIEHMVQQASALVERFADDGWLEWGAPLMPTFVDRAGAAREAEAKRLEDEERRLEAERRKEDRRRKQEADRVRREAKEKERLEREAAASRLSPSSSRTAARKTSSSSLADDDDAEEIAASQVSRGKGRTSKGKGKASTSTRAYQEPKFALPNGAALVRPTFCCSLSFC
jgi:hypothetical protein